jgi:hypothetical protein
LTIHAAYLSVHQASEKFAVALLITALILAFIPSKYVVLLIFMETFTRYSPLRKASTEMDEEIERVVVQHTSGSCSP